MNPHQKETSFVYYIEKEIYVNDQWHDTGIWVEVGGIALVICTISLSAGWHCNAAFRLVDENNGPLLPYRKSTNNRIPAHFTMEPERTSAEDQSPVTFHMIANCEYAKLQVRPADADSSTGNLGRVRINAAPSAGTPDDRPWNHKPISTMSVIPLLPNYQGGANAVFTYSQSRIGKEGSKDKKSSNLLKKNRPNSNN